MARVELRQDVQVGQLQVTLGDVANISSRDLPTLQRLMALPLGQVPRSGEAVALEQAALLSWIRTRLAIEPQRVAWTGAAASSVRLGMGTLSGEQIATSAQQQLQALLHSSDWRGEIELLETPREVSVPAGRVELKIRPLVGWPLPAQDSTLAAFSRKAAAPPPKRQSVWVDVWVDGRFVRTVPVAFEVSVFAPAYVAASDLPQGQVIDMAHTKGGPLVVRDVEWSGRRSAPLTARSSSAEESDVSSGPAQLKLRRPLAAGQPLTQADVEAVPLVARGDYATLHAVQGTIDLESRVEVLQDGAAGQSVRVKLPNASSAILARVTGPGNVEVRQ